MAAQRHIFVVATDFHLVAVGDDIAVGVDARIDNGLAAASASGLNLVDSVGNLEEAFAPLEEVRLEVGAQAVAHHIGAVVIDNSCQLIHLGSREELRLVDENPVLHHERLLKEPFRQFVEVGVAVDPFARALDADARLNHVFLLAVVDNRFHAEIFHAAFFEIVCCSEQQCGLCRPHCAISEIEFSFAIHELILDFQQN